MSPGWLEAVNLGAKQVTDAETGGELPGNNTMMHSFQDRSHHPSSLQEECSSSWVPAARSSSGPKELLWLRSQPLATGNPHSKIGEHKSSLFSIHENSEGPLQAQSSPKIRWTSVESVSHLNFSPCLILFPADFQVLFPRERPREFPAHRQLFQCLFLKRPDLWQKDDTVSHELSLVWL